MGFLAGVVAEVNRQEDAATRAEEFMMTLLEKRKAAIIPELMNRIEARKKAATERAGRVNKAVNDFNMSKEAAAILESSGKLEGMMPYLTKLFEGTDDRGLASSQRMKLMSEALVGTVSEEKLAAAMEYAFDTGYLENGQSDLLIEAVYANTEDEFEDVMAKFADASSGGVSAPKIGVGTINPKAFAGISEKQELAARKSIEAELAPTLGGKAYFDPDKGQTVYEYPDPDAAQAIIQNGVAEFLRQSTQVFQIKDSIEISQSVAQDINKLLKSTGNLNKVAEMTEFSIPTIDVNPPGGFPNSEIENIVEQSSPFDRYNIGN